MPFDDKKNIEVIKKEARGIDGDGDFGEVQSLLTDDC
jgi:hypothetical protein